MATLYGITPAGFVPKPLAVIQAELQDDLRATFGQGINLSASSVFGQLVNRLSERFAEFWDLSQADYNTKDPGAASGDALDNLCALTGTTRLAAKKSTFTAPANPIVMVGTNASPI